MPGAGRGRRKSREEKQPQGPSLAGFVGIPAGDRPQARRSWVSWTVIRNGLLYTGDTVLPGATIVMDGEEILQVLEHSAGGPLTPPDPAARTVDAAGRLVTPGLINAHTHIYSALARGIKLKDPPPTDFLEILQRVWWRLDRALTLEEIDLSARLHGIECLKHGVTSLFDHHASQRVISGSLREISRALGDLGLRACLSFEVSDRDGTGAAAAGIEENAAFIRETAAAAGSMRRAKVGLHASFTLSDETLKSAASICDPDRTGFHVHVAEGAVDQEATRARHGKGVIERLRSAGILGRGTICVHGVYLDDREIEILSGSGAWHAHCPESNMNNAIGAPSLEKFRRRGVRSVLGTDGFTANLFREALVGHLLQNHDAEDPRAGYAAIPLLLFGANAELASETFGVGLGRLRPGAAADLVVWDYRPPTPLDAENIWGHILFGLVDARADEVFIAGRSVLQAGEPVGCDEADVVARCRERAAELWKRF
jgi:putative selenium metabolism protein SsnA